MLPLPLLAVLAFYLLMQHLQTRTGENRVQAVSLTFIAGIYLLGASYGNHVLNDYLHLRFCSMEAPPAICAGL